MNSSEQQPETAPPAGPSLLIAADENAKPATVSAAVARQTIAGLLKRANYRLAAWWATQLADQQAQQVWPQWQAAEALYLLQQADRAMLYIDRALALEPENIACRVLKSRLYLLQGQARQALAEIAAAVDLAPDDSRLHGIRAELHVQAGDLDSAQDSFRQSLELDALNTDALLGWSGLPNHDIDEQLIEPVEAALDNGLLCAASRIKAHFALAQTGSDPDRQFGHLSAGNALQNAELAFDPAASQREHVALAGFFSADYFRRHASASARGRNNIFIVGFPRCGSTLVEQILSSHPQVTGAGETNALKHALREFAITARPESRFPDWLTTCNEDAFANIDDIYQRSLPGHEVGTRVTDKLLDNYRFIGIIHVIFPRATIIHVRRNPVDTCFSCYRHLFDLGNLPFSYDLDNLAGHYRDYRSLMRHWETTLPGRIHTVEYESLVRDQAAATRALLAHCQLDWDDACLAFYRSERSVRTSSHSQVRQKIHTGAIGRWQDYADHLGPLLDLVDD